VFIVFGAIARRGGLAGVAASDPVPQALVITGLVVAFAAPLGVVLRLDGPAALLVVLTSCLLTAIGLHAA
jgi:hypothetical protein